jgi:hypothetical protein
VDLDEVDVVGPQPLQAPVDLRPRLVAVTQAGLGGQEDPVADLRHPRPEPQLGVAVAGATSKWLMPASRARRIEASAVSWSASPRAAAP